MRLVEFTLRVARDNGFAAVTAICADVGHRTSAAKEIVQDSYPLPDVVT
tara:strand:+ start:498 stop:644 length:147 start_codon:yes stop_codon:yes gene_type:complete